MKKFKVTEYWRTGQDDIDFESKEITASTKEEAEKKYWEQNSKTKGFYKLKVEEKGVSESFGRMQELAGIVKEGDDTQNVWGDIDDGVVYDTLIDNDIEWLVSKMMSQAESDPNITLLDFLKQYGEEE